MNNFHMCDFQQNISKLELWYVKRIIRYDHVGFILGYKDSSTYTN